MYKSTLFLLLSFLFQLNLSAQDGVLKALPINDSLEKPNLKVMELLVKKNILYTNLSPGFISTSLSIEIQGVQDFLSSYIFFGSEEKQNLKPWEEMEGNADSISKSNLLIAKSPFRNFSFFSGDLEGKILFKFINTEGFEKSKVKKKSKNSPANCRKIFHKRSGDKD